MLKKSFRLKKNKDFRIVYKKGKAYFSSSIVMYTFKNENESLRLGFSVSKKIGKAVVRNRVKRKLREIYRLNLHKLRTGYDIIVVARVSIINKDYNDIYKDAIKLLKVSKVFAGE